MALSPQYSWPEPDNSSLVKNGAQDIRALGDAIDTSVWNVGYGQAGKNKIINGNFGVWQRGTSFSSPLSASYTSDRWRTVFDGTGATRTISQQTFTPGTAPVSGYEGQFFYRIDQTVAGSGGTFIDARQRIEDVRTFAGQPVTISFWAKAAATQSISIVGDQDFGSGGSAKVFNAITGSTFNITTAWTRYTLSGNVASVSGKTIGTSSFFEFIIRINSSSTFTVDLWGVQVEYGSKMTPFQLAGGGAQQAELALCQRYYYRATFTSTTRFGVGFANLTTQGFIWTPYPVEMRTAPTALEQNGTATDYTVAIAGGTNVVCNAVPTVGVVNKYGANTVFDFASGLTAGAGIALRPLNGAFLGWSAEL
jgi:hypothetical protein